MGRRRLAHPRPPARAGRAAEPAGAHRPGAEGRPALHRPHALWAAWPSFLTGVDPVDHGVYDILETVPGTHKAYPVTYKSIKARTFLDDLTAAKQEAAPAGRAAHVPAARTSPGTWWPAASCRRAAPSASPPTCRTRSQKAGPRVADQRHELDHVPQQARRLPGRGVRGHGQAHRRQRVADGQHRVGPDGQRLGQHRPHPALPVQLHRARPPRLREEQGHARSARRCADIFRQTDDAIGAFVSRARPDDIILFISDHGFQSCTRTINMDRLLHEFGYLDFSASNVVFGPMQWGPVRKVARKVYDTLGLHGKVALPQSINWSKTQGVHHDPLHRRGRHDQPRRSRDRRHRRPRRLREGARRGHGPPRDASSTPRPARSPSRRSTSARRSSRASTPTRRPTS